MNFYNLKKMLGYFFLIQIALVSISLAQNKYSISGYVVDKKNGESLIGATVLNTQTKAGTVTNTYGFFSITQPQDTIELVISYVGYKPFVSKFYLSEDKQYRIELESSALLDEVTVVGEGVSAPIHRSTRMSSIDIPMEQVKTLPAIFGEPDVLKALQLLPGVQSGTEGSSGIYVRGGGPDQNLILLDGVPIYNANHLFGFFSIFNPDAINNVELVKGGFPARYGGRLSSVIDVTMKEGNTKKLHGEGSIGLISSKLTLEGPIKNENTSFIISGRRTYVDILTAPIILAATNGEAVGGYYFYDVNAKLNHRFSDTDRVFASLYCGEDVLYSRTTEDLVNSQSTKMEAGLNWGNIISAVRWNHMVTPKLFANTTVTYSRYLFKTYLESSTPAVDSYPEQSFEMEYKSGIYDFAGKVDFDYLPSPNHYVRFGANVTRHLFTPGVFSVGVKSQGLEQDTTVGSLDIPSVEHQIYVEDDIKISSRWKVNVGLHYSGLHVQNSSYQSLQPRFSTRFLLNDQMSLKASYAEMTQYLHLLTNSSIGLPTDIWVPATDKVKPQDSWQGAVGWAYNMNKTYEVSVEAYYKEMTNLIGYKEGTSYVSFDPYWEERVTSGTGTSYGLELFIQKKMGRLSGWAGYTLSWANRKFDDVNFGKEFPAKYDRRHDFSIVGVFKASERTDLSATWVYGTGTSFTAPIGTMQLPDLEHNYASSGTATIYSERNAYKYPNYHRLDVSATFKKEKKWGERAWIVGVYNAYNRKNTFFITQRSDGRYASYALFPILPSVAYRFKF